MVQVEFGSFLFQAAVKPARDLRPVRPAGNCPFDDLDALAQDYEASWGGLTFYRNRFGLTDVPGNHLVVLEQGPAEIIHRSTPFGLPADIAIAGLLEISTRRPSMLFMVNSRLTGASIPDHPHAQGIDFGTIDVPILERSVVDLPLDVAGFRLRPLTYPVIAFRVLTSPRKVAHHFTALVCAIATAGTVHGIPPTVLIRAGNLYLIPRRATWAAALQPYKTGELAGTEMAGVVVLAATDDVAATLATASGRREIAKRYLQDLRSCGYAYSGLIPFLYRITRRLRKVA